MMIDLKKIVNKNANAAWLYKNNDNFKRSIDKLVAMSFGSNDLVLNLVDYISQLYAKYEPSQVRHSE